jgi:predicted CXXCH cytochrome family protein
MKTLEIRRPKVEGRKKSEGRRPKTERTCWAWKLLGGAVILISISISPSASAHTLLGSKHDLSVSGPGPIKAVASGSGAIKAVASGSGAIKVESEVCLFCHAPHNKGRGETALWNHTLSQATYTPYSSSTTRATIGQPTGASKLCLSCHDGTVALGMVSSHATPIAMQNGVRTMPSGRNNLGRDLSDDHPVSFTYDSALATADGQLKDPATLTAKVRLDHNKQVQCTSCHNAHDNQYGKFLVQNNYASALCLNCHSPNFWQNSTHRTSNKSWTGAGVNPWPHTTVRTVSGNGCENCHAPHTAGTRPRLLNFADEEQNCFSCHNGNVATKNIQPEFNKFSSHPIYNTTGVHDPMEDPINPPRHVECVDCHNPHAANASAAVAPNASGALAGVKGVNSGGVVVNTVSRQYEVCFRCHADSLARGPARVNRQFVQTNTRLQFNTANQSYHPVEGIGQNPIGPSLIPPYTTARQIYCTDCHNNDQGPNAGGSGPNGPHGSVYVPLLERQLVLTDYQMENPATYALCYKCHNRSSILSDQSFAAANSLGQDRGHRFHIVDQQTACTTCHDSHGVAGVKHLINFNRDYVTASSNGRLEYVSTGARSGNCSLTCHGKDHTATSYPLLLAPAKALLQRR